MASQRATSQDGVIPDSQVSADGDARHPPVSPDLALTERLAFERLLGDLSAVFTDLPAERLIDEIERALARLLEFLDFDRCAFGEFVGDEGPIEVLCSVARNGVEPLPRGPMPPLPWYFRTLRAGQLVVLHEIPNDLPAEARVEARYCEPIGLKSNLTIADAIHALSDCRARPMIRVNCAALPASLIEAELFGREKGAYTGALARQMGRFELADSSTLFLDEVGELPLELQPKLLRVLQDGSFERVGGIRTIRVKVRLIAATNRDLARAVAEGRFREDLYYRLNVFPVTLPPLRARPEDIPLLAWQFVEELGATMGKPIEHIAEDSMAALLAYPWPGNVRELRNLIERAMILARGPTLHISLGAPPSPVTLTPDILSTKRSADTLAARECDHIQRVLEQTGWRIRGPGGAAERLDLKPTTLESRMKRLGVRRPGSGQS